MIAANAVRISYPSFFGMSLLYLPELRWLEYATEELSLRAGAILIATSALSALVCARVGMLSRPLGKLSIHEEKDEGLVMVD